MLRLLEYGPAAVLLEVPAGTAANVALAVRAAAIDGVVDVVPAASTVLVRCTGSHSLSDVRAMLERLDPSSRAAPASTSPPIEIPVVYDGPDLADVAAATGLAIDDVVELHAGAAYEVAFMGFAPGFGYLTGLPDRLHLPRRATPRTRVPAGSVAIAAGFSAVYPTASPGGWHLLGRTSIVLWDVTRRPPALVEPGATVRFVRE